MSNPTLGTILAGAVNVIGTGLGMWAIDRAGRKPLLLVGAAGMCVSCVIITALQVLKAADEGSAKAEGYSIVVIILACEEGEEGEWSADASQHSDSLSRADVVFFELGMGSIPWLIGGEMLPEAPRATAMGLAAAVNWVFTTVIGLGFPPVSKALGNYSFVPFAAVLALTFLFTLRWVPETRGRTPAQVLGWIKTGRYEGEGEEDEAAKPLTRVGVQ